MNQSEYDQLYRRQGVIIGDDLAESGMDTQSIVVDGQTVAPLRLTIINSTPQERHERGVEKLQENVEVVGRVEGGVEIIRRTGGADYAGNDEWRQMMRRFGRLQ